MEIGVLILECFGLVLLYSVLFAICDQIREWWVGQPKEVKKKPVDHVEKYGRGMNTIEHSDEPPTPEMLHMQKEMREVARLYLKAFR